MSPAVRLLTPSGAGGVAVLEIVGPGALAALAPLTTRRPPPGALALVRLERAGELVDEALLWAESEERCELHLHASPPLVEEVLAALGGPAAREPESLEEQALELLAGAQGEAQARVLLDQAEGALRRALEALLAAARRGEGATAAAGARELLARGREARFLWRAPVIVLAGPTNAGKSTLFNALVGEERVLVGAEPGTTRDAVRARAALGPHAVDLIDTAGERALEGGGAASAVERAGQDLARSLARTADLVLRLVPAARLASGDRAPAEEALVLASRADELPAGAALPAGVRAVSALADPAGARRAVAEAVALRLGLAREPWQAGRPVPFLAEQEQALEALAADPATGAAALRRLLERA